jgi:transposase-like protein
MRQRYTNEFKAKVVLELLREDKTAAQVAAENSVHPAQLTQWKREFLEAVPAVFDKKKRETRELERAHLQEVEHLHKEIGHLTVQVNWLKKKSEELGILPRKKGDG